MKIPTDTHHEMISGILTETNMDPHSFFTHCFDGKKERKDDIQKVSWERFKIKGLPHKKMEDWHWSDIHAVLTKKYMEDSSGDEKFNQSSGKKVPIQTGAFFIEAIKSLKQVCSLNLDQYLFTDRQNQPALPKGVSLTTETPKKALEKYREMDHPMANLAIALVDQVFILRVESGQKVKEPIFIYRDHSEVHNQTVIRIILEEGAELSLIEMVGGRHIDDHIVTLTSIAERAKIFRIFCQPESPEHIQTRYDHINLKKNSHYQQTGLTFGADLARLETHLSFEENSAVAKIQTAYLLKERNHIDLNQKVDCLSENNLVRIVTKGVVTGKSRGAFQGYFNVARAAQKTDAQMQHHALLLSDEARVNAKPCLEIYADDVACAHGNTSGSLDKEALFYMRQRGLPKKQAKALLIEAFITEVLDSLVSKNMHLEEIHKIFVHMARSWLVENA